MNLRRKLLTSIACGAALLPAFAFGKQENAQNFIAKPKNPGQHPATQMRGGDYFPNSTMFDQRGKKFRLYDDLININRVVMINFMSIKSHEHYPVTEYLTKIADQLGGKLGRDVFIYSITTDPANDTPKRLGELAKYYGADRVGWQFLSSSKNNVAAISKRLFKHGKHSPEKGHPARLVHYGNGSVGVWGAFGADSNPDFAVERLSWMETGKQVSGLRRAGPARVGDNVNYGHNRIV